jgi:hypothetical protein
MSCAHGDTVVWDGFLGWVCAPLPDETQIDRWVSDNGYASTAITDALDARVSALEAVGTVLRTVMLDENGLGLSGSGSGTWSSTSSSTRLRFLSYSYTPVRASSRLLVEFGTRYTVSGDHSDTFLSTLTVGSTDLQVQGQVWTNDEGGGTRSGTLFPIAGVTNLSGTSPVPIEVSVQRSSGDDTLTLYRDMWLKVTEIAR